MSLLQKILNKKSSDDDTLMTNLAKEIGSTRPPIVNFKNEEDRELLNFEGLVKMVRLLDSDNEFDIMIDYSKSIDVNNMTARYLLDYFSVNRQLEAMSNLIERMKESNAESKLWANAYSLLYLWQIKTYELDLDKFLIEVNNINTENIAAIEIVKRLLKCYIYDQKKYYKQVFELSTEIEYLLNDVQEKYLQKVYSVRIYEILSNLTLLVFNDSESSRYFAMKVIEADIGKGFNAYAYYIVGQSYFYSSHDLSRQFFLRSIEDYSSMGRNEVAKDIESTLELLETFWGHKDLQDNF